MTKPKDDEPKTYFEMQRRRMGADDDAEIVYEIPRLPEGSPWAHDADGIPLHPVKKGN